MPENIRQLARDVSKAVESAEKRILRLLAAFVAVPTVNPPGQAYGEFVQLAKGHFDALGLSTRIVRVPKAEQLRLVPGSDGYPRMNLLARWDVGHAKTLHFNGHFDVVPPTSGWKRDPFKAVREGNRVYGRGTSDMKGALAAMVGALWALKQLRIEPAWNVELSFTCDEETGGKAGVGYLVQKRLLHASAVVVGEGSGGSQICYAHKGVLWLRVTVRGKSAHASVPHRGVNAFEYQAELVCELAKLKRRYRRRRTKLPGCHPEEAQPTMVVGGITGGGNKTNVVPDRTFFTIDRRILPDEDPIAARRELSDFIRDFAKRRGMRVRAELMLLAEPAATDPSSPLVELGLLARRAATRKRPQIHVTPGFLDMRFFVNEARLPTIGCGAEGGRYHGDDEFVLLSGLLNTATAYALMMAHADSLE